MVKVEGFKFLDIGIIYPIVDIKWMSPTQVVPKKSKVTFIKSKDGKMVLTHITTS